MTTNKSLDTATFDQKLLMYGTWNRQQREDVERWIKMSNDQKKEEAAKLMNNLIQYFLGDACTAEGRKCSKNLGSTLSHLEELLHTAKGGISKKFYRDHLNHMLRVMLLANAIATQTKNLKFNDNEIKLLALAALFHDIAYPLSEVNQVFSGVIDALNKCYRSMNYPKMILSLDMNIVMKLVDNLKLPNGMSLSSLGSYFQKNNHGVLSAMEFLQYVQSNRIEAFKMTLEAIMFHDVDFDISVEATKNKILALLVICDEMQDWGRPASFEQEPTISEIKKFELSCNSVVGAFVWDEASILSPLRQIFSKQKSLKRINLSSEENEVSINLSFVLPDYLFFDYSRFIAKLQELFICWKMSSNILNHRNIDLNLYQKLYYGSVGGCEKQVVAALEQNKLINTVSNPTLYFNLQRKEILLTTTYCGKPKEINFQLGRSGFSTMILGEEGSFQGKLVNDSEDVSPLLVNRVVSELFVFDLILSSKYSQKHTSTNSDAAILVQEGKITEFLKEEEHDREAAELLAKTSELRSCLKEKGFFSYQETTP